MPDPLTPAALAAVRAAVGALQRAAPGGWKVSGDFIDALGEDGYATRLWIRMLGESNAGHPLASLASLLNAAPALLAVASAAKRERCPNPAAHALELRA